MSLAGSVSSAVPAVLRCAVSLPLGVQGRVAVTTGKPAKDWACTKIHVTVVVQLDKIVAAFAALQAKSAVGKYVVPQTIFAWTIGLAANTREPFPIRLHRPRQRA